MNHPVFSFDGAGGDVGGEKVRERDNKKKMRIVARENSERKHEK